MLTQKRACVQKTYELKYSDLPLSCPLPAMRLWDAHPRVYLPIEVTGKEKCPYCGTEYILKDFDPERPLNRE